MREKTHVPNIRFPRTGAKNNNGVELEEGGEMIKQRRVIFSVGASEFIAQLAVPASKHEKRPVPSTTTIDHFLIDERKNTRGRQSTTGRPKAKDNGFAPEERREQQRRGQKTLKLQGS